MLAVALCLFVWRGLIPGERWREGLLRLSFWGLNGGLFLMFAITLLPVGIAEMITSYRSGLWLAKSAYFFDQPLIQLLGSLRIVPDTIIIVLGAVPLGLFFLLNLRNLKPAQVKGGEEMPGG
jgi:nitric oxide reductase subunit B